MREIVNAIEFLQTTATFLTQRERNDGKERVPYPDPADWLHRPQELKNRSVHRGRKGTIGRRLGDFNYSDMSRITSTNPAKAELAKLTPGKFPGCQGLGVGTLQQTSTSVPLPFFPCVSTSTACFQGIRPVGEHLVILPSALQTSEHSATKLHLHQKSELQPTGS